MIYVTGDTHGAVTRFTTGLFPQQKEMTKDEDFVIICGDFGIVWGQEPTPEEIYWLDWLEDKPFTTLFIDGNHENHVRLNQFLVEEWKGGKVHKLRPHVIHLMRGEVYEICGKKIFAFGGASSHDISDGILDGEDPEWRKKAMKLRYEGKNMFRVKGVSWWEEEMPTEAEMKNGLANLEKHSWKVDYIISHSPSANVLHLLGGGMYEQDILTNYLEEIRSKTEFKRHFCGHMHVEKVLNDRDFLLYRDIIRVV